MSYDRAQRRLEDNRHRGTTTGDYTPGDDIATAVYPDPKARTLYGESETLQGKRAIHQPDDATQAAEAPKATAKTGKK